MPSSAPIAHTPPIAPDDSAVILARMLHLHPKVIDLSLERMTRLLEKIGDPHMHLPPSHSCGGHQWQGFDRRLSCAPFWKRRA